VGGIQRESQEAIGKAFVDYFDDLFTTGQPDLIDECLETVQNRILDDMNARLLRPFCVGEVGTAFSQMVPLKAPGPDGFNAFFFSKKIGPLLDLKCVILYFPP
jgi:hypothetical protein